MDTKELRKPDRNEAEATSQKFESTKINGLPSGFDKERSNTAVEMEESPFLLRASNGRTVRAARGIL